MRDLAGSGARFWRLGIIFVLIVAVMPFGRVAAAPPANSHFERTWSRTDRPVLDQQVNRTWMWGPDAFTGEFQETFRESPGGVRTVQYFDKSRMEISDTGESMDSIWYVTNGLLVVEMMTGRLQTGMNQWETRQPAKVNVAGDASDPLGATYQYFGFLRDLPAKQVGAAINEIVSPGSASNLFMYNDRFLVYGATAAYIVPETGHTVASPFWSFMNSSGLVYESGGTFIDALFANPFYATGYPVTEAYWAVVKVGNKNTDVLIQCFERRCLTYTPSNFAGWQVEAGNVGQHYYTWRYGSPPSGGNTGVTPLPEMIWTDAYSDPVGAVRRIIINAGNHPNPNDWVNAYRYALAPAMPGLYSMSTAVEGSFNHDTRDFYNWLEQVIYNRQSFDWSHACRQSYHAIFSPNSDIYRRIQSFEAALEHNNRGDGPIAYWIFVYHPLGTGLNLSLPAVSAQENSFLRVWDDYGGARISQPGLKFAEYAAERSYLPMFCMQ